LNSVKGLKEILRRVFVMGVMTARFYLLKSLEDYRQMAMEGQWKLDQKNSWENKGLSYVKMYWRLEHAGWRGCGSRGAHEDHGKWAGQADGQSSAGEQGNGGKRWGCAK
jgi:hypothetical protein